MAGSERDGDRGHRRGDRPSKPGGTRSGRPGAPAGRDGRSRRQGRAADAVMIWGFHAVSEALRSPRRTCLRLFCTEAAAARLSEAAAASSLDAQIVASSDLDALVPRDAVHQGAVLEAKPLEGGDLSDLPDEGTVLVLDQLTDPHNVGAILRTAAAFGVAAVVTTERHAPEMTGVLAKSASGGLEHVPVIAVGNLARALDVMGRAGYQLIGLDSDGDHTLEAIDPAPAVALVLGAEGRGLRRLTRERCDLVARLDMPGPIKSLNVSNACAVALTVLRVGAQHRSR